KTSIASAEPWVPRDRRTAPARGSPRLSQPVLCPEQLHSVDCGGLPDTRADAQNRTLFRILGASHAVVSALCGASPAKGTAREIDHDAGTAAEHLPRPFGN